MRSEPGDRWQHRGVILLVSLGVSVGALQPGSGDESQAPSASPTPAAIRCDGKGEFAAVKGELYHLGPDGWRKCVGEVRFDGEDGQSKRVLEVNKRGELTERAVSALIEGRMYDLLPKQYLKLKAGEFVGIKDSHGAGQLYKLTSDGKAPVKSWKWRLAPTGRTTGPGWELSVIERGPAAGQLVFTKAAKP